MEQHDPPHRMKRYLISKKDRKGAAYMQGEAERGARAGRGRRSWGEKRTDIRRAATGLSWRDVASIVEQERLLHLAQGS